ncbi:MAG: DHHA1 domain-containing protein, partial [Candidatus Zipacnadales bacterium]
LDTMPVIVLASESWHVGVVGIAASQIVAMFGRPTLLLAVEGDYLRGSGRSIPEFHLAAALDRCADILERYGGHAMAVGATLKRTCFEAFRDRLNEVARQYIDPQQLRPFVEIDAQVSLTEVTAELVAEFEQMEPFGSGNPAPLLAIMGVRIVDQTLVGRDGQHLKLWVTDERYTCECIGFGMAREAERLKKASRVDLCFVPQTDTYDGSRKLQLCLQAVRPSS